ncbi:hypothetical protein vBEcoMWL3_gp212 [Escherichia phage vB_EcoM_WL-3]|nr:hypothetical protein vBEcoMWL3_gp212 [Escherichia phage vB_EcoM_WL-3]
MTSSASRPNTTMICAEPGYNVMATESTWSGSKVFNT